MQACPDDNLLARVVQADATGEERATIERHIDVCPKCAELVAHLARTYFDGAEPESRVLETRVSKAPDTLAPGTRLGRYELGPKIGAGGMGTVYAARDPVLRRPLALKVIPQRGGSQGDSDRLLREARAMARVTHPNVVTVYDAGVVDGVVFVAMELVKGPSLRRHLWLNKSIDAERITRLFVEAGRGLAAAHAAAVVHRDFKPENVLVTAEDGGRARVTDFGLARPVNALDAAAGPTSEGHVAWVGEHLTRETGVKGTPAYMSPEQLDGVEIDERSDQFSFAVALYEALWKSHPFPSDTIVEMRRRMNAGPVVPPDTSTVPGWVLPIVLRALRVRPKDRFASMTELVDALERGEARGADWHLMVHAFALGAMFFIHLGLVLIIPIGLMMPDDGTPGPEPQWALTAVTGLLVALVCFGWAPAGLVVTVLNIYGLLRRRRWAFITTAVYAATAFFSCVGAPYAIFALWSLTRPSVRAALGRPREGRRTPPNPSSAPRLPAASPGG